VSGVLFKKKPLETPHGALNNRTWHLSSGYAYLTNFLMTTSVAYILYVCVREARDTIETDAAHQEV